jgi:hypothetical protein
VLARRAPIARVRVERTIYERILARLRMAAPRYYAFPPAEPGYGWAFRPEGGARARADG